MKHLTLSAVWMIAVAHICVTAHAEEVATAASSTLAEEGRRIYAGQCSRCHGYHMINEGLVGFDLRKFPKDDRERFVNSVSRGKQPRMPPWGDVLSANDIEALWAYIRTGGGDAP
jgi:mono/diheme cytochrome c family protein